MMKTIKIGGVILLLAGLLAIMLSGYAALISLSVAIEGSMAGFYVGIAFSLVSLVAGIVGIVNRNKTNRESVLYVFIAAGAAIVALIIWEIVYFLSLGGIDYVNIIISLVPHGLLIFGAVLNMEKGAA